MRIGGQINKSSRTTRDVRMFASRNGGHTSSLNINRHSDNRMSSRSSNFLSNSIKMTHDHSRSLAKRDMRSKATVLDHSPSSTDEDVAKFSFDENDELVMSLSDKTEINIKELKDTDYSTLKQIDSSIAIDPSLKIGTGDDELVDNIVAGAKQSLGGIGAIIPD